MIDSVSQTAFKLKTGGVGLNLERLMKHGFLKHRLRLWSP